MSGFLLQEFVFLQNAGEFCPAVHAVRGGVVAQVRAERPVFVREQDVLPRRIVTVAVLRGIWSVVDEQITAHEHLVGADDRAPFPVAAELVANPVELLTGT